MTLMHYWKSIVRHWIIIVICIVLMGAGAYIGSKLQKPLYQSSTIIEVSLPLSSNNQSSDYLSLLASDQLVQTDAQLAVSDPVLRAVAANYPGMTVDELAKNASSSVKTNTQLFVINVLDPSPTRAAKIANDIANTLISQQTQATQQQNTQSQKSTKQQINTAQGQIDQLNGEIAALQKQPQKKAQVAALQAQLVDLKLQLNQLQAFLTQLELAEMQNSSTLIVEQPAQPVDIPVRPQVRLITAMGFSAGLLLGVLLAILLEQLDTRVRTAEALTDLLGWPALATIWRAETSKGEAVMNPDSGSPNAESFRILRTNLGFSSVDKPLHSLVVTSLAPGDGKSTVAANLAIFMAKSGKSTLIVDADLRHPTVNEKFGLQSDKLGLSNAILAFSMMQNIVGSPAGNQLQNATYPRQDESTSTNLALQPFIHTVGIPNLWVMPTGPLPPNPSELLDSKGMERLTTALTQSGIETVIYDTPPLIGLSDTSILTSKVDGTLIVFDITRTRKGNLEQMKRVLAQSGTRVLGFVVNKLKHGRKDGLYSYYYYSGSGDRQVEKNGKKKNNAASATTSAAAFSSSVPTAPIPPNTLGQRGINSINNGKGG